MAKPLMLRFAKWHIWLGWLIGIPILMWMVTGLFMSARPIDEVRGNHLRLPAGEQSHSLPRQISTDVDYPVKEIQAFVQDGRPVATLTAMDGSVRRIDLESGNPIAPLDEAAARSIVAKQILGGNEITSVRLFEADSVPFDFRRPIPVWQIILDEGTYVYVGRETGQIEAIRTQWWRTFDFMWGLHIMDLQTREKTSHPILIAFAALGVVGSILGCILMFRRRKARAKV